MLIFLFYKSASFFEAIKSQPDFKNFCFRENLALFKKYDPLFTVL